jgi:hypothetical protein
MRLLAVDGVTGVGIVDEALAIYLERDDETVRSTVRTLLDSMAPDTPARFFVTGRFEAQ